MEKFNFFDSYDKNITVPDYVHEIPEKLINNIPEKLLDGLSKDDILSAYHNCVNKEYFGKMEVVNKEHLRVLCSFEFKNGICKQMEVLEWPKNCIYIRRTVLNDRVLFKRKEKKLWHVEKAKNDQNQNQDKNIFHVNV